MTTQPHGVGDVDLPADARQTAPLNVPSNTARAVCGESAMTTVVDGAALRDILIDRINTTADGRPALRAVAAATPLSRDRHAIDVTDHEGVLWRVDVHDHPRRPTVA